MVMATGAPPVAGVVNEDSPLGAAFVFAVNVLAAGAAFALGLILVRLFSEESSEERTPFAENWETDKA